jgi:hypothetical protein
MLVMFFLIAVNCKVGKENEKRKDPRCGAYNESPLAVSVRG